MPADTERWIELKGDVQQVLTLYVPNDINYDTAAVLRIFPAKLPKHGQVRWY